MQTIIEVKKIQTNACIPEYATAGSAGMDLSACIATDVIIEPGETKVIPTGLSFAIPHGFFIGLYPRSGLSTKEGLRLANCVGVIDEDYRGEIKIALHNDLNIPRTVRNGERVCQAVIMPYVKASLSEKDELSETDRNSGGFGSTGK